MKKNKVFIFIILVLITALLVLIIQENQTTSSSETSHQVSVVVNDSNSARWSRFRAGLEQAAKDYNINLNYVTTTKLDGFDQEQEAIDKEIENGSDAVIVQLVDNVDSLAYVNELSKKTTLALVETDVEDAKTSKSYSVTQPDNASIGSALAQMVIDSCGSNETIGIVTGDSAAMSMRYQALKDLFQQNNIQISWTVQTTDQLLHKEVEQPVTKIVALDNDTLEGAAASFKDGRDKPMIYGVGCSDKSIYYLDNGKIAGMIVPNEYTMGYVSLSKVAIHLDRRLNKMEDTTVDYFTITKDNLYSTENQKMLFPIVG